MSSAPAPVGERTFRSPTGLIVLIGAAILAAFLLGDAVVRGSWGLMLLYAPWVLLVLWCVYELSYVSMVRVGKDGVVVRNLLRRTTFGWARVRDIDLRWQLEFSLDDGRTLSCWGGPGRARPPRASRREESGVRVPQSLRTLGEIRDLWEDAGERPSDGADAPIRRTWDVPAIAALVVLVVWAVIAVVVTR